MKEECILKTPAKAIKTDKTIKGDKGEKSSTDRSKKGADAMSGCEDNDPLKAMHFDKEITKGLVAERVGSINNTPESSPIKLNSTGFTQKKMLSTRNRQLVVEEDDILEQHVVSRALADHAQLTHSTALYAEFQHDDPLETDSQDETDLNEQQALGGNDQNDLTSILRELSSTVKRLEKSVSHMNNQH